MPLLTQKQDRRAPPRERPLVRALRSSGRLGRLGESA
jgi:hypothetical protein